MENWVIIYATKNFPEANIIKGMLEENNVPVLLMNKQDSSYINFGEIELYVPVHLTNVAKQLVNQTLMN